MEEKKSYKSWTISDTFWEAVKKDIPERSGRCQEVFLKIRKNVDKGAEA